MFIDKKGKGNCRPNGRGDDDGPNGVLHGTKEGERMNRGDTLG